MNNDKTQFDVFGGDSAEHLATPAPTKRDIDLAWAKILDLITELEHINNLLEDDDSLSDAVDELSAQTGTIETILQLIK